MNNGKGKVSPIMSSKAAIEPSQPTPTFSSLQTLEELIERQNIKYNIIKKELEEELTRVIEEKPRNEKNINEKLIEIEMKFQKLIQDEIEELKTAVSFSNTQSYIEMKEIQLLQIKNNIVISKLKLKEIQRVRTCVHCFCCFCCLCVYPCFYTAINNAVIKPKKNIEIRYPPPRNTIQKQERE